MKVDFLKNKIVLISGGTGSFGKTLVKYLITTDVKEIRIFSRDENKQDNLRLELNNPIVKFFIGDIRDYQAIFNALRGVDFVFHAAALKQVPSCEFYPMEAVKTNIIGSNNLINAAQELAVGKIIMLSTDKAAMPINAMGMSKALMEKLTTSVGLSPIENNSSIFCATRYGNVMGSRGSVIPLFTNLIKSNKVLNVTDLNMTRFMMSLQDSIELVLFAMQHGAQGELFVQKAPSATLKTLIEALEMILKKKAKIQIIGFRHSEKMHETLLTSEEAGRATDLGKYYQVQPDNRDLNYALIENKSKLTINKEEFNSSNTYMLNSSELADLLLKQNFMHELI